MGYVFRTFLASALIQVAVVAEATYHTYQIDEMYSNSDGTVQYIVLHESMGMNGENLLAGHTLTSTHAGVTKGSYTFTGNLPGGTCGYYGCGSSPTANTRVLIGTNGFAALGLVTPNFVIPNGFLPTDGGTVNYAGVDMVTFGALPIDGTNALYRDGTTRQNLATNFAGASASVVTAGPPPAAVNYQGLWWNAPANSEPFWGINFAHSGDRVFATWYTYDTTGKAWWLSMLADKVPGTAATYSGDLLADSGPPFSAFVGTGMATKVGTGTLTFSDANNGSFHYDLNTGTGGSPVPVAQTKFITRYDLFTGPQVTCTFDPNANLALAANYQDLWWEADGSQSGWGINFAHQGDSVFATWYTYNVDGTPLWLSALLKRDGMSNEYVGDLLRSSGPRFDNYNASAVVQPLPKVGTASVKFANGDSAEFDYTTDGTNGLPVTNQHKSIARYPFTATGGTLCN